MARAGDGGTLFIAGDWGTTAVRLALCGGGGVLDRRGGPGVADRAVPAAARFDALTADWRAAHGPVPAMLCGMVGSTLGWADAGYVACPADAAGIVRAAHRFVHAGAPVRILPGLRCAANPLGAPDVMRGEETQVLGALALAPALARGVQTFVLPGTHTKWVVVEDGRVTGFLTALTGELFALLRDHGTLGRAPVLEGDDAGDGFAAGVARQAACAQVPLTHLLFEIRSRHLCDGFTRARALAYLSGMLIGADVAAGLRLFAARRLTLIGEPALTGLYEQALGYHGAACESLDGGACALAGLRAAAVGLYQGIS
jgi:2-dehydro-3-deoxygalactonokinase